jgi:hypothetical protein
MVVLRNDCADRIIDASGAAIPVSAGLISANNEGLTESVPV